MGAPALVLSVVVSRALRIWALVQVGCEAAMRAATPAAFGEAMLVPFHAW